MPPKRGMSAETKRQTILGIFHETKDVFVLKDIEKIGSKRGVVSQAIKEVLQSLVDDDLVHGEKIGTSNYYWSFPSETTVKATAELERARARAASLEAERAALEAEVARRRAEADSDAARLAADLERELEEWTAKDAALTAALAAHADADPERYAALEEARPVALSAANRWLDNVQCLKSWMRKRFQGNEAQVDELFRENGLRDDDDYLEIPAAGKQ